MKRLLLIIALLTIAIATSCHSTKTVTKTDSSIDSSATSHSERIESITIFRNIVVERPVVTVEYPDSPRHIITIKALQISARDSTASTTVDKATSLATNKSTITTTTQQPKTTTPITAFLAGMGATIALLALIYIVMRLKN